jgi:hypothetical protein
VQEPDEESQQKEFGPDSTKMTKLEKIAHFEKDQEELKPKYKGKKSRQLAQQFN